MAYYTSVYFNILHIGVEEVNSLAEISQSEVDFHYLMIYW